MDIYWELYNKTAKLPIVLGLHPADHLLDGLHTAEFLRLCGRRPKVLIVGQNPSRANADMGAVGIPFCTMPGDLEWLLSGEHADDVEQSFSKFWQWASTYPWFFEHFLVWNFLPQALVRDDRNVSLQEATSGTSRGLDARRWTIETCCRSLSDLLDSYPTITRVVLLGAAFERPVKKICEARRLTLVRAPHPSGLNRSLNGKSWAEIMTKACR